MFRNSAPHVALLRKMKQLDVPLWRVEPKVPRVELSYVPLNGSRGGAVLAPLFSQWV